MPEESVFSWLLEGSRFSAQKPRVEEEILAEFTPALPGLGMTINTAFFSNRLANHDEQRGIMTRVETIGVVDGRDDARGLNRVVRAVAPPAISTLSLRAEGATFEGRA